jgi:hypothetical protein
MKTQLPSTFRWPWLVGARLTRQALLLDDRFEPAAKRGFGLQTVVLARSRCRFKWFRLSALPAAERLDALRVQARAWQPFDDSAYVLSLRGETGLAVAWDRLSVQRDLHAAGHDASRCRLLPETLMRQASPDGAHLVQCMGGVEGQIWREGWLCASRWWPSLPVVHDWRLFLYSNESSAHDLAKVDPPALIDVPRSDKPSLSLESLDGGSAQARGLEGRLMALCGLAIVVCAAALARQTWELQQSIARSEAAIVALRQSAAAVLVSRDQALAKAAEARQIAAWLTEIQPIEVLVHLHEMISKSGAQIKEMDLTGNKLRLGLQLSPQSTRSGLVKDFQAGGWFKGVTELRGDTSRGLVVMEMTVEGLRPPLRSTAQGVTSSGKVDMPPPSAFAPGATR